MHRKSICLGIMGLLLLGTGVMAQTSLRQGAWFGHLIREDGKDIRFHFDVKTDRGKTMIHLVNASEKLKVDKIRYKNDSVIIEMPVFESQFRARILSTHQLEGIWIKEGSLKQQVMIFKAETQQSVAPTEIKTAVADITGKWAATFTKSKDQYRPAIAEWQQKGNTLRGTFLTPTGDYRYLSGVVNGDSLQLSTFDGSHAFLFTARIESDTKINGGMFYSGATSVEPWVAVKDANAVLPDIAAMYLKDGEEKLNFRFMDLNKKLVSINDPKFRNKVVVIQIMGSWCPNCMDETAFLSDYYNKNKQRGIEVIGLAYEYSTDFERSRKGIQKFRDRFNVQYTLLNTGVTVSDSLRTEKTLPQLTPIKSFPSTIFIDRKGRVAKIKAGFEGPGTGIHYEEMKKEFEETITRLLKS
ncbi:MAG: TlpA disulfide reductase family protein [Bacteroidota bacterium]